MDACVIAPLVEESVFRLNLSKEIKKHYFSLGIATLFFLLTLLNSDYYNGYIFFIYSFFVLVVYKITKKDFPINTMLIASSIVFGLVHVSKLDPNLVWNPISYLVYTSPLMVLGYYFGLIRIKHRILLAMVAHFLKNFFAYYLLFK